MSKTTKMHRVVLYVKAINNPITAKQVICDLQNGDCPEFVTIGSVKTVDIGEWHDDHELNFINADHEKYFK